MGASIFKLLKYCMQSNSLPLGRALSDRTGIKGSIPFFTCRVVVRMRFGLVNSSIAYSSPFLHSLPSSVKVSSVFVTSISQPFGQPIHTIIFFSGSARLLTFFLFRDDIYGQIGDFLSVACQRREDYFYHLTRESKSGKFPVNAISVDEKFNINILLGLL